MFTDILSSDTGVTQHPQAVQEERGTGLIESLTIKGNRITDSSTVVKLAGIKQDTLFDTTLTDTFKHRLKKSGLFRNVNTYSMYNPETKGYKLFILLKEYSYFKFTRVGGAIYQLMYGEPYQGEWEIFDFWWRVYLGVAFTNFRGKNETLSFYVSLFKSRSVSTRWYKPVLNTPFAFSASAGISYTPSSTDPMDTRTIWGEVKSYLYLTDNQYLYTGITPSFQKRFYRGDKGFYTDTLLHPDSDALDTFNIIPQKGPAAYDTSWANVTDTAEQDSLELRAWSGYSSDYLDSTYRNSIYEAYFNIGFCTDQRNPKYDTESGTYFNTRISSNFLYPENNRGNTFYRWATDLRLYHRGIWESNTVAYRARTKLTFGNPDRFKRLYAGGLYTLRGTPEYLLGRSIDDKQNHSFNRALFSLEYRFPMFKTKPVTFPRLQKFNKGLKNLYYRFDAALFIDGAYLWRDFASPISTKEYLSPAFGIGAGIRMMIPNFKTSINFDAAINPERFRNDILYTWDLYLDMLF